MAFRGVMICLFHLSMIKEVGACGGNSALEVVEMCKEGSTTARHFYLHGSPAGDVQRCECSLTLTGTASSMRFTPAPLTDTTATCGGTLTLPDGVTEDCTRTSRADVFLFLGTTTLAFTYNTTDVRCCVEVKLIPSEGSISITCPGSTTKPTQSPTTTMTSISSHTTTTVSARTPTASPTSPLQSDSITFSSTLTPSATTFSTSTSTIMPTSTMTSSSENHPTSYVTETQSGTDYNDRDCTTVASQTLSSFPVSGSFIAGWVIVAILVAVIVVLAVLLIRKQRQSNYEHRDTCQQSVSTQTDGGSIYEGLDRSNLTTPDTMYERLETQSAEREVKDYYNIEMDGYANP